MTPDELRTVRDALERLQDVALERGSHSDHAMAAWALKDIDRAGERLQLLERISAAAQACMDEGRVRASPEHARLLLALQGAGLERRDRQPDQEPNDPAD